MQTNECHDQLQNGNADTGHQSARLPRPIVSSESEEKQHGGPDGLSVNHETVGSNGDFSPKKLNYVQEFKTTFENFDVTFVRQQIIDRGFKRSSFISILWRILLHIIPRDMSEWEQHIDRSRDEYEKLIDKFKDTLENPVMMNLNKNLEMTDDHPLSVDHQRRFIEFREQEQLLNSIKQDVNRTFPDIYFFQQQSNRDSITRILYNRCKFSQKPIPYRQGMHEILAVIIHLLDNEIKAADAHADILDSTLKKIYDRKYREHDAFTIYSVVLEKVIQFYDLQINEPMRIDHKRIAPFKSANDVLHQSNTTVKRINEIFENLQYVDLKCYTTLKQFKLDPIVYSVRWVRLLFAREIPIDWIPKLWTVIFAYDDKLTFVEYFFKGLLITAHKTYESQPSRGSHYLLQILMRTNIIQDIEQQIKDALEIGRRITQIKSKAVAHGNFQAHTTNDGSNRSRRVAESHRSSNFYPAVEEKKAPASINRNRGAGITGSRETEMTVDPGKQTIRMYQENINMQNRAANEIYEIINEMRLEIGTIDDDKETIETMKLKLTGCEQIAHVLSGKTVLNKESLQSLVDYGEEHKRNKCYHRS